MNAATATPPGDVAEDDSSANQMSRLVEMAKNWARVDANYSYEASNLPQNALAFYENIPFDHSNFTVLPVHIRLRAYAHFQRAYRYHYSREARRLYGVHVALPPIVPISKQLT